MPPSSADSACSLTVGDKAEGRYGGGARWNPCIISALHQAGSESCETVDASYEDGKEEKNAPSLRFRLPGQKQPRNLREGEHVEARFQGHKQFYSAQMTKALTLPPTPPVLPSPPFYAKYMRNIKMY